MPTCTASVDRRPLLSPPPPPGAPPEDAADACRDPSFGDGGADDGGDGVADPDDALIFSASRDANAGRQDAHGQRVAPPLRSNFWPAAEPLAETPRSLDSALEP